MMSVLSISVEQIRKGVRSLNVECQEDEKVTFFQCM